MLKPVILIIFGFLLTNKVHAQQDTVVIFFKNDGKSVSTRDSADYVRMVLPPDTSVDKTLFTVREFYLNGKLKRAVSSPNKNGWPYQGTSIEFYANSHKKRVCNIVNGQYAGAVYSYYPNGKLYTINEVKDTLREPKMLLKECRDSTGKVLAENGNGYWQGFNDDFSHILREGQIKNYEEDGDWHGGSGDSVKVVFSYKGGKMSGTTTLKSGEIYHFDKMNTPPQFRLGIEGYYNFLAKNISYPAVARQNGVTGKVYVQFVVEKDGSITNEKVTRGISKECDQESLRVIKLSGKWLPGLQYGVPVRSLFTLPITFTLQEQ